LTVSINQGKLHTMTRTFQIINFLALVVTLTVNALANILPINGMNTGQLSALYPSLFTPAGFTFSIWSVIYLLLIGFVIFQRTISDKPYFRELSLWFWLSCLANSAWILAWHYQFIFASVVIMLTLLYSLAKAFLIVQKEQHFNLMQKVFIKIPFVFYLSWICVATIANTSALLVSLSWEGGLLTPVTWTMTMISIASVLGIFITERYREPAFLLVLIWALFGIYSKWTGTGNNSIAVTALSELILLAVLFFVFLFGLRKKSA
jgi:translocator protein